MTAECRHKVTGNYTVAIDQDLHDDNDDDNDECELMQPLTPIS